MIEWLIAGLVFGAAGSLHCVGMCGPLVLAVPGPRAPWRFWIGRLVYHTGRTLSYITLGGLIGAFGWAVALQGYQGTLSLVLGVLMLSAVLLRPVRRWVKRLEAAPARLLRTLRGPLQSLLNQPGPGNQFALGILNGLLPCGFSYAAVATALAAGSLVHSMLFMGAFGLATFPALLAVQWMGRRASTSWRATLLTLAPYGIALVGLLLILRGLSLGTFLSPELREAVFSPEMCRFIPLVDAPTP
ncbi:MAG: sulfite exporter TauE/SafE family protein [Longimonas sp.]|uniref:sulfite exporter TauE/SafE family protein n=1 Tax=Longimonas sp. TaxID=2039626 RepID=UPI003975704E